MGLIERYLQAVRFWLSGPARFWLGGAKAREQQDDIIEELRDDIRSRIEERETSLGRATNEDELVALLRQTGHPMWVAARYQPQRSLIGPALFPLYQFVLKIVALGYLVPWFVVWLMLVIFIPSHRAANPVLTAIGGWAALWANIFVVFGVITLLFAILERVQSGVAILQKWDPRKLPRVSQRKQRVSRVESIFGLIFSAFFIFWWLTLPRFGHLLLDPLGGAVTLNPALRGYYLLPLVPTLVLMVQQCMNLFRPQWTWLRALFMLLSDLLTLGILAAIAGRHPYLMLVEGAKGAANYARAIPLVNRVISLSLLGIAICVAIAAIVHCIQTIREVRRRIDPPASSVLQKSAAS